MLFCVAYSSIVEEYFSTKTASNTLFVQIFAEKSGRKFREKVYLTRNAGLWSNAKVYFMQNGLQSGIRES